MNRNVKVGVALFLRRDGKILLTKRSSSHGKGTWAPPGGHLDFGESPEECAIREAKEEVGVCATDLTYLGLTNDVFQHSDKHYITLWFSSDSFRGNPYPLAPNEVEEAQWFAPKELPSPLFLPLQNLLAGKGYTGSGSPIITSLRGQ